MGKNVTFGEVLMRLSPPSRRTIKQTTSLDLFFGGTELNVATSLATMGLEVQHVSAVSDDIVGEAALHFIKQFGIDVTAIGKNERPLGLYFLEVGSAMRSSHIAYNRSSGSFANISPDLIPWTTILKGCSSFHWTGITPGISENAYLGLKKGLEAARGKGMYITADPAYRSNLWQYGREVKVVLEELIGLSTVFIGGVNEINEILTADFDQGKEGFIMACKELLRQYPNIEKVFDKVRTGLGASCQKIYGRAWTGDQYLVAPELEINNVVDRIGTGDAYAAGIIYGLQHFDDQGTLEYANAACALKHTFLGDTNFAGVEEILEIVAGNMEGRIKR
ncbi:MAG: sugar kinase [Sediminicola sp.]